MSSKGVTDAASKVAGINYAAPIGDVLGFKDYTDEEFISKDYKDFFGISGTLPAEVIQQAFQAEKTKRLQTLETKRKKESESRQARIKQILETRPGRNANILT